MSAQGDSGLKPTKNVSSMLDMVLYAFKPST